MKLRERFWGVLGSVAVVTGSVLASEPPATNKHMPGTSAALANQVAANDIAKTISREVPGGGYSVDIEYRKGTVILRGWASGPAQLNCILRAVQSHSDVQRVVNHIEVRGSEIHQVSMQEQEVELAPTQSAPQAPLMSGPATPAPLYTFPQGAAPQYDAPYLPPFAWPAKAPYPNYSAVQYPRTYAGNQWPYIGPFNPYPEPPLDWRKVRAVSLAGLKPIPMSQDPPADWQCVTLRWNDGHWYLSFGDAWWARRGFLGNLCHPVSCDAQTACGGPTGGYRVSFDSAHCTSKYVR